MNIRIVIVICIAMMSGCAVYSPSPPPMPYTPAYGGYGGGYGGYGFGVAPIVPAPVIGVGGGWGYRGGWGFGGFRHHH